MLDRARRALRDPLAHFLLLGATLSALHHGVAPAAGASAGERDPQRITLRAGAGAGDDARMQAVLEEELLYREAVALGLDRGDPVVRRRLVQKMEFLLEEPAVAVPPDDAELEAWIAAHPERYRVAGTTTLEHVFFSPDRRGADAARADALAALAALEAGATPAGLGDAFPLAGGTGPRSDAQLAAGFGAGAVPAIAALPLGAWAGPVRSSYGWHLVRVHARTPARAPTLAEVRARAQADLMGERRATARRRAIGELRRRYDVRIEAEQ